MLFSNANEQRQKSSQYVTKTTDDITRRNYTAQQNAVTYYGRRQGLENPTNILFLLLGCFYAKYPSVVDVNLIIDYNSDS